MHGRMASIMRLYDADAGALCTNGMEDKEYLAGELPQFVDSPIQRDLVLRGDKGTDLG